MPVSDIARRFQVALIKPSHYDDDGYVIQWFRSFIPSNSLAAVHGLVEDARLRNVLGDDVAIGIDAPDELAPVEAGETETLELFTHNEGARAAVQHARKIKELTGHKAAAL